MNSHEELGEFKLPEYKAGSGVENVGENAPEKSWAEEMAEVGDFDKGKAEEAVEADRPSPEELERKTTRTYEAEIIALDQFAENADFLDEPIEEPTETDLVRSWDKERVLHMYTKEVQDWLHSKELSPEDEEYRKELLKSGDVKMEKRFFYRPSEGMAEKWEKDKESYIQSVRQEKIRKFSEEQDMAEQRLEDEIHKYEPSREGQMSEKGDLVRKWIENDSEASLKHADLIIDWLNSDDGTDMERRYRALTRVKLSDKFSRLEANSKNESLNRTFVSCMRIPVYAYSNGRQAFVEKLRSGEVSSDFAELSEEERERKWRKAEEKEREKEEEERKEQEQWAKKRSEGAGQNSKVGGRSAKEGSSSYSGGESTPLPDQGPDLTDPLSLTSPFSIFNGPNN